MCKVTLCIKMACTFFLTFLVYSCEKCVLRRVFLLCYVTSIWPVGQGDLIMVQGTLESTLKFSLFFEHYELMHVHVASMADSILKCSKPRDFPEPIPGMYYLHLVPNGYFCIL